MADALLKAKAHVNVRDGRNFTPLYYADNEGAPGVAQVLRAAGAKKQDHKENKPTHSQPRRGGHQGNRRVVVRAQERCDWADTDRWDNAPADRIVNCIDTGANVNVRGYPGRTTDSHSGGIRQGC